MIQQRTEVNQICILFYFIQYMLIEHHLWSRPMLDTGDRAKQHGPYSGSPVTVLYPCPSQEE